MDLNKLELFCDIAETKNFTRSGERMGYTQPAVSHAMKTLEQEIGFSLFLRTKTGLELTHDAEAILPTVRKMLEMKEELTETISSINGVIVGHLTIACFSSISRGWLPQLIKKYRDKYPGVEIKILEGGPREINGWINDNVAQIAFLSERSVDSLKWIPLVDDPMLAILPEDYPAAKSFPLTGFNDEVFIISSLETNYDLNYILSSSGIHPNISYSSQDDLAIASMVSNGLGTSILPELVVRSCTVPIRRCRLTPECSRSLGVAYRPDASLTPVARYFIEIALEAQKEGLLR